MWAKSSMLRPTWVDLPWSYFCFAVFVSGSTSGPNHPRGTALWYLPTILEERPCGICHSYNLNFPTICRHPKCLFVLFGCANPDQTCRCGLKRPGSNFLLQYFNNNTCTPFLHYLTVIALSCYSK